MSFKCSPSIVLHDALCKLSKYTFYSNDVIGWSFGTWFVTWFVINFWKKHCSQCLKHYFANSEYWTFCCPSLSHQKCDSSRVRVQVRVTSHTSLLECQSKFLIWPIKLVEQPSRIIHVHVYSVHIKNVWNNLLCQLRSWYNSATVKKLRKLRH